MASAVTLHLEGRLTLEADTHALHELVQSVTEFGPCNVILDLGKVWQLDCAGIGQLVQLRNQVCAAGRVFALINVERRQKRILRILGLLAALRAVDTRQEAMKECPSAAGGDDRPPWSRLEAFPPRERPFSIHGVFPQASSGRGSR